MNETVIIILAAGASSRMHEPKQLLPYRDKSFLAHTVTEAQKTLLPVIVVLGANASTIKSQTGMMAVEIVVNEKWKNGISSSIIAGLNKALERYKDSQNCIFSVCDQPYITSAVFLELVDQKKKSGKKLVASCYEDTLGTPCLFDKEFFGELLMLRGDLGAKSILQKYPNDVASVDFQNGKIDVDTRNDYEELLKNQNQ